LKIINYCFLFIVLSLLGCNANPDDLKSESSFFQGIDISRRLKRPILLTFNGYGTMSTNEFNEELITSKKILKKLNEEYVTIQLRVDDSTNIQERDTLNMHKFQFSEETNRMLRKATTMAKINIAIQVGWFKSNAQPLYVIIDSDRNILVEPFYYTSGNRTLFLNKLDEGLRRFKNK
jgi:hypothetical protein